jgi:predicted nucleic acid-binding protein
VKGIADTGFLVAFANRKDQHHEWAVELAGQITDPFLTCEAVLAETAFHLEDASYVLSLMEDGLVRLALDVTQQLSELAKIAKRFADRKPDLADVCLIRISELYPKHSVATIDVADFRIYRRHRNEAIPLLIPSHP